MITPSLRYARHHVLDGFGEEGQARLAKARVLVVGLGGIGSAAALYLASSGLGALSLNDFDTIDPTNLPRQPLYEESDLGARKAEAAARRLGTRFPELAVEILPRRLEGEALEAAVRASDLVLDASDNFPTRFALNASCVRAGRPLVVAAAQGYEIQLTTVDVRRGPGCYRCLFVEDSPEDAFGDGCRRTGILAPLAASAGTLAAAEAMRILAGQEPAWRGRLVNLDARTGRLAATRYVPDPSCPVCGRRA
jgi:molybdopterin/thiamine biosynthesis adenylyltransferase